MAANELGLNAINVSQIFVGVQIPRFRNGPQKQERIHFAEYYPTTSETG